MSTKINKEIYDDIVLDYAAAKTNVFKVKHEETKFWKEIGDVKDQTILDLACGSGYFTRQMKEKGLLSHGWCRTPVPPLGWWGQALHWHLTQPTVTLPWRPMSGYQTNVPHS